MIRTPLSPSQCRCVQGKDHKTMKDLRKIQIEMSAISAQFVSVTKVTHGVENRAAGYGSVKRKDTENMYIKNGTAKQALTV